MKFGYFLLLMSHVNVIIRPAKKPFKGKKGFFFSHNIYNGILFSHKKKKTLPFATAWTPLQSVTLSELSQTQEDKYDMISLYVESKSKQTYKAKERQIHRYRRQTGNYQRGRD